MFTGIIEEIGKITAIIPQTEGVRLEIAARQVLEGTRLGDSIAVNGVCLTVTELSAASFKADVSAESLSRSTLAQIRAGAHVNLERALQAGGRLGGHIVQGHVDGQGTVRKIESRQTQAVFHIDAPADLMPYIVEKGSIAVNGISLTVNETSETGFSLWIIPHTLKETNLEALKQGDNVNLEVDILAKYVEHLLARRFGASSQPDSKLSLEWLKSKGW